MPVSYLSRPPRIAIIGAGPAGLTLASVLHHQLNNAPGNVIRPEITIFERDSARASRDQGGTLDMHGPTGQRALKLAGLWAEFQKVARAEGDTFKILDKDGKVWMSDTEDEGAPEPVEEGMVRGAEMHEPDGRPEIDRGLLNGLLIDSLPAGWIQWGRAVAAVTPQEDGTHQLTFADGQTQTFDLVIGADGAWSRVRRLLTNIKPQYSGIQCVEVRLSDVDARYPQIASLVGPGMIMALGDNKCISAQRNSGSRVRVYLFLRAPESWAKDSGIDWTSLRAAKPALKQIFEGWNEDVLQLLDLADEPENAPGVIVRGLYMLPPDQFRWAHRRGVTLLGDAAHLMTPFAGEGANMAMADGAELAESLVRAFTSIPSSTDADNTDEHADDLLQKLDAAVREYEANMFPRAEHAMRDTYASLQAFMNPHAPETAVKFFRESMQAAMEATAAGGAPGGR